MQPGKERPRLAPGPRKSRQARDQRTRGNGRGHSIRVQPIRWRQAEGPEASGGANPEAGVLAARSRDGLGCGVHPVTAGGSRGLRSGEGRRGEGRARLPGVPRGGPLLCGRAWELTFQGEAWRPLYSHFWLEPSHALTFSPGPTRPPKPRKGFVEPSRPPSGADWPSVQCSECVGRPGVAPAQPWTSGPPT